MKAGRLSTPSLAGINGRPDRRKFGNRPLTPSPEDGLTEGTGGRQDTSVVHDDRDIRGGRGGSEDGIRIREIETQRHDPVAVGRHEGFRAFRIAHRRIDFAGPVLQEGFDEGLADAPVGSGDEGGLVGEGGGHGWEVTVGEVGRWARGELTGLVGC